MFQSLLSDELSAVPAAAGAAAVYFPSGSYGLAIASTTATDALVMAPTRDATARGHVRSLPDKLRCGYTSKRCENPRTVKKSGGLHRFCAYHRERANKNQWRVDNRRRILRRLSQPSKSGSDCGSPRSSSSDNGEDGETPELFGDDVKKEGEPSALLDLLDPAGSPNTLSEQDATILNAMLFSDEDEPMLAEATRFGEMQVVAVTTPTPVVLVSADADCSSKTTYVVSGTVPCACAQCMAWSTMYYYQDALESARKSRVETYSRV